MAFELVTPIPHVQLSDEADHRRKIANAVSQALYGKLNCVNEFTLTANSATTTLADSRIGYQSLIIPFPKTANAALEIGNGTMYIATFSTGTATITHANNAQSDRTFRYAVLG